MKSNKICTQTPSAKKKNWTINLHPTTRTLTDATLGCSVCRACINWLKIRVLAGHKTRNLGGFRAGNPPTSHGSTSTTQRVAKPTKQEETMFQNFRDLLRSPGILLGYLFFPGKFIRKMQIWDSHPRKKSNPPKVLGKSTIFKRRLNRFKKKLLCMRKRKYIYIYIYIYVCALHVPGPPPPPPPWYGPPPSTP